MDSPLNVSIGFTNTVAFQPFQFDTGFNPLDTVHIRFFTIAFFTVFGANILGSGTVDIMFFHYRVLLKFLRAIRVPKISDLECTIYSRKPVYSNHFFAAKNGKKEPIVRKKR